MEKALFCMPCTRAALVKFDSLHGRVAMGLIGLFLSTIATRPLEDLWAQSVRDTVRTFPQHARWLHYANRCPMACVCGCGKIFTEEELAAQAETQSPAEQLAELETAPPLTEQQLAELESRLGGRDP